MKRRSSRKLLQITLGLCALAPIFTGLLGMSGIDNPIYPEAQKPVGVLLDSNLRFLNGLSVGIGVYTLYIVPTIGNRAAELRVICLAMFFAAIGRLISVASYGWPPLPFNVFLFVELLTPPLFVFWQSRIATCRPK